ncbi:hypothetical protein BHE74_00046776 [Ensete ventricosum]|nr:hypothetical protein BHE74_00046776 [Ensete ventricosum]RZS10956.1 hypothetical protein BHM03_00042235 [Ensete ventricosum]
MTPRIRIAKGKAVAVGGDLVARPRLLCEHRGRNGTEDYRDAVTSDGDLKRSVRRGPAKPTARTKCDVKP